MDHIRGLSRNQLTLFPEALDDYISQENPVRFIDAHVDALDLHQLGFRHATLHETGHPPYHPADLLKLYLYGYLNRVRSSRQLEREAHRNVEVMWLLRRLTPDFKTIADFRRDNRQAIRNVSREFTLFCRKLDLFSGDLVAIDGSKFKAVNRRDRNFTKKQLKHLIQKLDEDIDRYLDEMDQADADEPEEKELTAEELQEKIEQMKRRRAEAEEFQKKIHESGDTQISLTDPDSRMMAVSGGRRTDVAYNVQVSVDPKHKLIVDHEVTNAVTDRDLLSTMAKRAKDLLGVDDLEALADMGYPGLLGQATMGRRSRPAWRRVSPPTSPSPRPPPAASVGSLAKLTSAMIPSRTAIGVRRTRNSPIDSKPQRKTERSSTTPPVLAPNVP